MDSSRRRFLAGAAVTLGMSAGCVSSTGEQSSGAASLEETVTVSGLDVVVDEFLTAPALTETEDRGGDRITPPDGAMHLLVHVRYENNSETRKEPAMKSEARLLYRGQEAETGDVGFDDRVLVDGTEYTAYQHGYRDENWIYPGNSFEGWLFYVVPEGFEASEAVVEIEVETEEKDVAAGWRLA